jgi:hypothetical protein
MKLEIVKISLIIYFVLLSTIGAAQTNYIFFYRPYTDKSETNLYRDTNLKFDYRTQYNNIKRAIVATDVENAISHNDYRFVSISGNSYLFPGLEHDYLKKYKKYIDEYKHKVIEGTSDMIGPDLPFLQPVAYDYAKQYNFLLFLEIKKRERNKVK